LVNLEEKVQTIRIPFDDKQRGTGTGIDHKVGYTNDLFPNGCLELGRLDLEYG
jgi:hypothetical protein